MTMIDTADSRFARAVALAATAGQWIKCRRRSDDAKCYGILSSKGDRHYLVTSESCECFDAKQHRCYHQIAVAIHCALVRAQQPKPKAKKPAAAPAPADRGVVLSMVREPDGTLSWERAPHTAADYGRCHSEEAF